jgi:FeS assembly protein IscX
MRPLTWEDAEEIAIALAGKFPAQDPLQVRFTDLRRWVLELPGFSGDPAKTTESALEAIQMAWLEEWRETQ